MAAQTQLLEIVDTPNPPGAVLRLGQRRQEHRRQNGNDGDDDQQLNQCEPARRHASFSFKQVLHLHQMLLSNPNGPRTESIPQIKLWLTSNWSPNSHDKSTSSGFQDKVPCIFFSSGV